MENRDRWQEKSGRSMLTALHNDDDIYIHPQNVYVKIYIPTYEVYIYIYIYIYINKNIHTYRIHTHIYIYIYTHT